jgi:hypothetical protein
MSVIRSYSDQTLKVPYGKRVHMVC